MRAHPLVPVLRVSALITLVAGFFAAWFIWNNFGQVSVPIPNGLGGMDERHFTNPVALPAAIGVAVQGVVTAAALGGLSAVLEGVSALRQKVGA